MVLQEVYPYYEKLAEIAASFSRIVGDRRTFREARMRKLCNHVVVLKTNRYFKDHHNSFVRKNERLK